MLEPSSMAWLAWLAQLVEGLAQPGAAGGHLVEARQDGGAEVLHAVVGVDLGQLGQVVVVDDGPRQVDLATRRGIGGQQVALGADGRRPAR